MYCYRLGDPNIETILPSISDQDSSLFSCAGIEIAGVLRVARSVGYCSSAVVEARSRSFPLLDPQHRLEGSASFSLPSGGLNRLGPTSLEKNNSHNLRMHFKSRFVHIVVRVSQNSMLWCRALGDRIADQHKKWKTLIMKPKYHNGGLGPFG